MDRRLMLPLPTILHLLFCLFLGLVLLLIPLHSQRSIVVNADLSPLVMGVERYCRQLRTANVETWTSAHGKPGSRPPQCRDECKDCHGECAANPVYLDRSKAHGHAIWTCACLL